jgi:uncharacterized protein with PIN domain
MNELDIINELVYIRDKIEDNPEKAIKYIQQKIKEMCEDNRICPKCLCELKYKEWKEPRPYQEGYTYERMSSFYCPLCNKDWNELF